MEKTVEAPSAAVEARKATDTHSSRLQRTETTSGLDSDKAHAHEVGATLTLTGDGGREKGGTRKLKVIEEVHSTSSKT
jgi:hypothetical protein